MEQKNVFIIGSDAPVFTQNSFLMTENIFKLKIKKLELKNVQNCFKSLACLLNANFIKKHLGNFYGFIELCYLLSQQFNV